MSSESKHAELNARKWDSRAKTYDDTRFDYMRYMQKRTIALLPLRENLCFLDIGCGTGWAVRHVATLLNQRGEFNGIDISPKMIGKAQAHSHDYPTSHFHQAAAEELVFTDNYFDLIICTNSFHHYLFPARALNEIRRVLKPAGRVYITDVTADGIIAKTIDRVVRKREREHVKFYSTRDYQHLFAEARLEHVASRTIMPPLKVHIGEKPR